MLLDQCSVTNSRDTLSNSYTLDNCNSLITILFIANLISQFIQQHVVVPQVERTPTTVLSGVATIPNELLVLVR